MKKSIIFTGLFITSLCLASHVFAQDSASNVKQQLKDKLYNLRTYQAKFTQTVTDSEGTVLQEAQGKIVMSQPNKLYWELLEPNESILLADGDTLWNIDSFMEQVVAYDQNLAIENNPLILLTDPYSKKWQDYNVAIAAEEFIIEPISANGSIEVLRLFFKGEKLLGLETRDTQQQTSRLTFSDIQQNKDILQSMFSFSLPIGYELDDQRNP
ncbi:outer membrane lipoprotein chaperone LolA [Paraglaciecola marina]|uniref:outer membrane lipoprotein chaperone LolA n=1 Tax=Paraglaciecola marina TaxID=2500157 RepID=UPI00105D98D8|nr:outer membrane lipoprotein chaperone LolA [Paraglaciecola marina]